MAERPPIQLSKMLSPSASPQKGAKPERRNFKDFMAARESKRRPVKTPVVEAPKSPSRMLANSSTSSSTSRGGTPAKSGNSATLVSIFDKGEAKGAKTDKKGSEAFENTTEPTSKEETEPVLKEGGSLLPSESTDASTGELSDLKVQLSRLSRQLEQKTTLLAKAERDNRELKNKNEKLSEAVANQALVALPMVAEGADQASGVPSKHSFDRRVIGWFQKSGTTLNLAIAPVMLAHRPTSKSISAAEHEPTSEIEEGDEDKEGDKEEEGEEQTQKEDDGGGRKEEEGTEGDTNAVSYPAETVPVPTTRTVRSYTGGLQSGVFADALEDKIAGVVGQEEGEEEEEEAEGEEEETEVGSLEEEVATEKSDAGTEEESEEDAEEDEEDDSDGDSVDSAFGQSGVDVELVNRQLSTSASPTNQYLLEAAIVAARAEAEAEASSVGSPDYTSAGSGRPSFLSGDEDEDEDEEGYYDEEDEEDEPVETFVHGREEGGQQMFIGRADGEGMVMVSDLYVAILEELLDLRVSLMTGE